MQSANVTATGTVVGYVTFIRGYRVVGDGTNTGSVVLRDGGASGRVVLTLQTTAETSDAVMFPDEGIYCATDIHATVTTAGGITVFFE